MSESHADIIDLERPLLRFNAPMPRMQRAAQFAPFAGLRGYNEEILENNREVDGKEKLCDEAMRELGQRLILLSEHISEHPTVTVTYFRHDLKKARGRYVTEAHSSKRIDLVAREPRFGKGTTIPMDDILKLESGIEPPSEEP